MKLARTWAMPILMNSISVSARTWKTSDGLAQRHSQIKMEHHKADCFTIHLCTYPCLYIGTLSLKHSNKPSHCAKVNSEGVASNAKLRSCERRFHCGYEKTGLKLSLRLCFHVPNP